MFASSFTVVTRTAMRRCAGRRQRSSRRRAAIVSGTNVASTASTLWSWCAHNSSCCTHAMGARNTDMTLSRIKRAMFVQTCPLRYGIPWPRHANQSALHAGDAQNSSPAQHAGKTEAPRLLAGDSVLKEATDKTPAKSCIAKAAALRLASASDGDDEFDF
jgi:hypothetical protein